jgi:hypothetical protein
MVLCFFYSPEFGHVLMPCSFSCAVLSVLFSVGKRGEQGAVSSIKIYIWFAWYAQSPEIIILLLKFAMEIDSNMAS